jgi:hypothetical protein
MWNEKITRTAEEFNVELAEFIVRLNSEKIKKSGRYPGILGWHP